MLQVKSVVILKANPGILKHGGGIKMWIWLSVERGSYLGFENKQSRNEENRKNYAKKDAKRVSTHGYGSENLGGNSEG